MTTPDPNAPPTPAPTTTPPTPAAFDANVLPPALRKYAGATLEATLAAAAQGYVNVQSAFTRASEELATLKPAAPVTPPATPPVTPPAAPAPKGIEPKRWEEIIGRANTGKLTADDIDAISENTGLPAGEVEGYLAFKQREKTAFMAKAQEALGAEIDFAALRTWLESDKSGFTAQEVAGMNALLSRGDVAGLNLAKTEFLRYQAANPPRPAFRDSASLAPSHNGFTSRRQFSTELSKAMATGSQHKVDAVHQKLQKTPQHVLDSADWTK